LYTSASKGVLGAGAYICDGAYARRGTERLSGCRYVHMRQLICTRGHPISNRVPTRAKEDKKVYVAAPKLQAEALSDKQPAHLLLAAKRASAG